MFWLDGGHALADPLTQLKPDGEAELVLETFMETNAVRIARGIESFRRALKEGRTRLERIAPWEPPPENDDE